MAVSTIRGLVLGLNFCGLPGTEQCICLMNGSVSELPLASCSWLVRLKDSV